MQFLQRLVKAEIRKCSATVDVNSVCTDQYKRCFRFSQTGCPNKVKVNASKRSQMIAIKLSRRTLSLAKLTSLEIKTS